MAHYPLRVTGKPVRLIDWTFVGYLIQTNQFLIHSLFVRTPNPIQKDSIQLTSMIDNLLILFFPASAFQTVDSHFETSQPQLHQEQPDDMHAKQPQLAEGERFSEPDIRERIEFCRNTNQWAPLVHILGILFSDVGILLRSFAIPSVAKGSLLFDDLSFLFRWGFF